ncbi:MAG TPA: MMPL family transporter [Solirubrobacteraceae bacterium]|jgi:RND superfamily putative drug exporter|nr:MMPL family transporter [Solirubrobacteraceae bacterium]
MLRSLAHILAARPRRTLIATLVFVIIAGAIGGPLAGALTSSGGFAPPNSDSQVATRMLQRAAGTEPSPGIVLLVNTPHGPAAAHSRIAQVNAQLLSVRGVVRTAAPADVAQDGRHVLVTGTLSARADDKQSAKAAEAAFAQDRDVTVGGAAVAGEQINSSVTHDLGFAELLAFPLLIALSILFFRGRAALMPVVVGVVTVLGTFLVLTGVNHVYGLSIFALNLVIGMGLGLAVDYTLFLVTRFRQELAAGAEVSEAIATTMARAGQSVLFSAVTVAFALATLTLFPQGFLKSMGIAGACVAVVAALAALTVSPALLAVWGRKLARTAPSRNPETDRWYRFARRVMRRPGLVAAVTAVLMLAAALPALSVRWSSANDSRVIPQGESARVVADALNRDFAGAGRSPVTVAISAAGSDGGAVTAYAHRIATFGGVSSVSAPRRLGHDTWQIDAAVAGDPAGDTAQRVVNEIRAISAPFTAKVTGDAATFVDQQNAIGSHLPEAIILLAVLTFLVLWLMTGSVVLPLKAIVMNALTVGASLAPLILIYQHGNLTGLLGYTSDGGVEPTDFVVAATVVFALSTDYGVFLLGRIKEAREAREAREAGTVSPRDEREAVATGLGATGRVVTAAAILLAVAIGAFSTSSISFIQEIGVAVATGVLLDAFIVRSLLVPSLMALLGRWNWWAPPGLRRLHDRIAPREARRRPVPAPAV